MLRALLCVLAQVFVAARGIDCELLDNDDVPRRDRIHAGGESSPAELRTASCLGRSGSQTAMADSGAGRQAAGQAAHAFPGLFRDRECEDGGDGHFCRREECQDHGKV